MHKLIPEPVKRAYPYTMPLRRNDPGEVLSGWPVR
jgi:hypothetical protein